MPASQGAGSQNFARENLASRNDHSAEQSILPPFSGKLSVDEELKLSNENFKQSFDDFFKDKNITPLSQLTAVPTLPTPYVLAQFASKAYTDHKTGETDAQYETRLALPGGWKLLTTASNTRNNNGYFGAAYWHPEHQQVVIAHRGTKLSNLGAIFSDIIGVLFKHHVPQMCSASTFAYKVVEVLRKVNHQKGTNFQVFFTGHSLGGWLAQITTFTSKYLKTEETIFLKRNHDHNCYHPHTVVFDSPGCKDMLSQMTDKLDVRLNGRSIDLQHLDITSYLSAPNRVNTCNAHLGMVYRIFVDLTDMGWREKHTALYNKAMHSMEKIVEAFDPETGQVRKDEQGQLKVQVVMDWPLSSGLSRSKEYKRFFEWAKPLNNYNPDITDEILRLKGYHPIRYQTKNYDDRVSSVSIFSQEEQHFLESYLWLRQLPEFLKPKELFSPIRNNEVQDEAVTILQSFEIETDTIRCSDANALQALIPCVKRLLQVFPELKGNIKRVLSSHEIRNKVYQFETGRYTEQIKQSPLDFKADALSLRGFLSSDQQVLQLHMTDGDEWTGLVKAYQVLQKTNCLSEGQYTIMKLKRLLTLNNLVDFGALMLSTKTPHLILVACEANELLNSEKEDIVRTLFNTIKQKPSIKFILSTGSENSTVTFLQHISREIFGNGFVRRDEQFTWSDITTSSQEKLLEKTVSFQGTNIALNELIPADSPLVKLLPLVALLEGKQLTIGNSVPISNAYDGYYIGRTFRHQIAIKQDIFSDKHKKEFPDLIACTDQEFEQLCQQDQRSNIHWLKEDEPGKLVWQQSRGSLETLRKYTDTHSWHTYTPGDLDKLLEQAHKKTVMLISDTAGMGKSTILTHLSKQIKQNFPAKWVVRIDLNDHTDALEALKKQQISSEKAIEFVAEKMLKLGFGFERELFKECCEQKQKVNIVIMLDGFDEISPNYKETVIALLQALRQTAIEQLWVTTRPHLREELEDNLQQLSYTLEPFSEENQVEFLTKYWCLNGWFAELDNKEKMEKKIKLEICAKYLIKNLTKSISDKGREFTGIPLQCHMLAEAFNEEVKAFCQSAGSVPELPFSVDLLGLYKRFMSRKYDICVEEKFKISMTNVGAKAARKEFVKSIRENHQILALKTLLAEEQAGLLQIIHQCSSSDEDLTRTGIVQRNYEGKPHFIHRTFAEYYVAEFLVNQLTTGSNTSQQVQDLLLQKICVEEDYRVVRAFIDGLLSKSKPSREVLKQYGNRMRELRRAGLLIIHQAAHEGDAYIIGFLLDSVQAAEHTDTLKELLLAQDRYGRTSWQRAAECGNLQVLNTLWECAKEKLTPEELKNKLFLAKDNKERIAWHYASCCGNVEALQKLWECGKETLTAEELNNKLLLAKDNKERTAWQLAAQEGNLKVLQKLWEWAKMTLTAEQLKNKLFLSKGLSEQMTVYVFPSFQIDSSDKTAWHLAAEADNLEVLQQLCEWAEEVLTPEELKNKLLLSTTQHGKTAWHYASLWGKLKALQKLWEWGQETLTTEELNNKLLLGKDNEERTAWHLAAERGNLEVLQKLWEWARERLTGKELNDKLLLAKDNKEGTAWHYASWENKVEALQKLWEWGKEKLRAEELNDKLLLGKDNKERTAWHLAAERGNLEVLHKLWEWGKETLTAEELYSKLLLTKDNKERTAWHLSAEEGNVDILQKLWECAKEKLRTKELNDKLLLAKDSKERTACHYASWQGNVVALQKLWDWGKEELTAEELNNKLLLAKDNKKQTAWHYATWRGNVEALQKLWEWGKEELTKEDLNNKLLLAKDKKKRTAWHLAAKKGGLKVLKKLWECGKETLTAEELCNKLLLAKDNKERNAWHWAAKKSNLKVLKTLWESGKETLTAEKLCNKLLLAKDHKEQTAWHLAAEKGNLKVLQKLWKWGKETLTTEELYNKLLLAKDHEERTAWHLAAESDNREVLQKLWEWGKEKLTAEELNNKLLLAKGN
jgi:ankyrin repeat protein